MKTKTREGGKSDSDLSRVQGHYEDLPYPMRNPEDDKTRLRRTQGVSILDICHYLYKGKQNFNNFRVLCAGAGTGDAVIFLAEQLRSFPNAEVVYLDFSKASLKIAQRRAEIRGLTNITWISDSILNIPKLKIGKFDHINCVGVLHHLKNPDEALKILQRSLKDDGGMDIMVYAQYGRTGVYQVQEIMKMVNQGVNDRSRELKNGWAVINSLPESNWFRLSEKNHKANNITWDHHAFGDIGLYDLFLHKQDRAYTVPQLYDFIEQAGLNFVEFVELAARPLYKVENYIADPELRAKVLSLPQRKQQAIAELLSGEIIKHSCWISNKKDTIAQIDDMDLIPYLKPYIDQTLFRGIYEFLINNPGATSMNINATGTPDTIFPTSEYSKYLFKHMINQDKSFGEIFECVYKDIGKKLPEGQLIKEAKLVLNPMIDNGHVVLRDKSIPPLPIGRETP